MNTRTIPFPEKRTQDNINTINSEGYYNNSPKINNSSYIKSQGENELFDSLQGNMSVVKLKQIEDMRQKIMNYTLLTEKTMFFTPSVTSSKVNKCNIILFGPSGSGKSSFIKSIYRALYNSPILPQEIVKKLIIRGKYLNEGTLCFTQLQLVEPSAKNSGIILCDTRGHFKMNEDEKEQFRVLLGGKIKDGVQLSQRKERNPLALWEFWKKDSELFPTEIFKEDEPGINSIPHSVVFVFDGSTDEVILREDEFFYRQLVNISKNKGYINIHVILTRIDIFEKNFNKINSNIPDSEKNVKLNILKDMKIQRVIDVLGIDRNNIHFIENYHDEDFINNSMEIDYGILKTLTDVLNSSELFLLWYMNQQETCLATCFGGNFLK